MLVDVRQQWVLLGNVRWVMLGYVGLACVASVSARVRRERRDENRKKKRNDGGGGGERSW